jgi:hypothetical protein
MRSAGSIIRPVYAQKPRGTAEGVDATALFNDADRTRDPSGALNTC